MHHELLANLQAEAQLKSALNLPTYAAIEDVDTNKESLAPSQDNTIIAKDNKQALVAHAMVIL